MIKYFMIVFILLSGCQVQYGASLGLKPGAEKQAELNGQIINSLQILNQRLEQIEGKGPEPEIKKP